MFIPQRLLLKREDQSPAENAMAEVNVLPKSPTINAYHIFWGHNLFLVFRVKHMFAIETTFFIKLV